MFHKKELDIGTTKEDFTERVKLLNAVKILPIDDNIWITSLKLDWQHRDLADRVIVTTAKLNKLPIITSDQKIRSFYRNTIW